jgi:hypothetical protein
LWEFRRRVRSGETPEQCCSVRSRRNWREIAVGSFFVALRMKPKPSGCWYTVSVKSGEIGLNDHAELAGGDGGYRWTLPCPPMSRSSRSCRDLHDDAGHMAMRKLWHFSWCCLRARGGLRSAVLNPALGLPRRSSARGNRAGCGRQPVAGKKIHPG